MTVLEVFAGVCGFKTVIEAETGERYHAVCTLGDFKGPRVWVSLPADALLTFKK